jgi:hypothetical protein
MSDPTLPPTQVRIEFRPYSYSDVQRLLQKVYREFGMPGLDKNSRRWDFETAETGDNEKNVWIIDFRFRDPHDAIIFGLKYSR